MNTVNLVALTNSSARNIFVVPSSFMKWAFDLPQMFSSDPTQYTTRLPNDIKNDLSVLSGTPLPDEELALSLNSSENDAYMYVSHFLTGFASPAAAEEWCARHNLALHEDEYYGCLTTSN